MVPVIGLEPTRSLFPRDSKSRMSTNFITPASIGSLIRSCKQGSGKTSVPHTSLQLRAVTLPSDRFHLTGVTSPFNDRFFYAASSPYVRSVIQLFNAHPRDDHVKIYGAEGRTRTDTIMNHEILSLARLPISPLRHDYYPFSKDAQVMLRALAPK